MTEFFDRICQEYAEHGGFSGACLLKSGDRTLYSGAFGCANRGWSIPNRPDTRFDTASVTKIFTAAAILLLVERGLLRLEDTIQSIVDLNGTQIPDDVTIHHLLSHTSGIADDADEEAGEDYSALFRDSPNYAIRECRDFLKNFAYKAPLFPAGTGIRYNNCAFVLLGLALEAVTGQDYRGFVTREIFEKCGMESTAFLAMDEVNENTAEGYYSIGGTNGEPLKWKKNIYSYPPIGSPDAGAYTTVGDLDRFLRAVRKGELLSEESAALLLSPRVTFSKPYHQEGIPALTWRMGYAFEFLEQDGEIFAIFKDGLNDGVSAMFSYYPKLDLTLSLLANQNCNVWEMHRRMQAKLWERIYK